MKNIFICMFLVFFIATSNIQALAPQHIGNSPYYGEVDYPNNPRSTTQRHGIPWILILIYISMLLPNVQGLQSDTPLQQSFQMHMGKPIEDMKQWLGQQWLIEKKHPQQVTGVDLLLEQISAPGYRPMSLVALDLLPEEFHVQHPLHRQKYVLEQNLALSHTPKESYPTHGLAESLSLFDQGNRLTAPLALQHYLKLDQIKNPQAQTLVQLKFLANLYMHLSHYNDPQSLLICKFIEPYILNILYTVRDYGTKSWLQIIYEFYQNENMLALLSALILSKIEELVSAGNSFAAQKMILKTKQHLPDWKIPYPKIKKSDSLTVQGAMYNGQLTQISVYTNEQGKQFFVVPEIHTDAPNTLWKHALKTLAPENMYPIFAESIPRTFEHNGGVEWLPLTLADIARILLFDRQNKKWYPQFSTLLRSQTSQDLWNTLTSGTSHQKDLPELQALSAEDTLTEGLYQSIRYFFEKLLVHLQDCGFASEMLLKQMPKGDLSDAWEMNKAFSDFFLKARNQTYIPWIQTILHFLSKEAYDERLEQYPPGMLLGLRHLEDLDEQARNAGLTVEKVDTLKITIPKTKRKTKETIGELFKALSSSIEGHEAFPEITQAVEVNAHGEQINRSV